MSCIHYKFSNTVENDKIKFDGLHISVADLREAIIKQKGLKSNQYTLKIIDSQTKKEYSDAKEMLPRNTSIIVSRAPVVNAQRVPKARFKDPTLPQSDSVGSKQLPPSGTSMVQNNSKMLTAEELKKTADLVNANATEEEKVKAMISQSVEGYDSSQYVWTPRANPTGALSGLKKNPPPPGYTCNRCGIRGHWIQFCPTNGDPSYNFNRYKRPTGTPMSQIVTVTEDIPGVMVDRHGQLVVRAVDLKALQDGRKKKLQGPSEAPKEVKPPPELICGICKELMKDAVIIPCCGESYCYECIYEHLCENEFTCPGCKKENISPDNLAPNKALRMSAKNFQMKAAEDRSVAVASTTGFVKKEAPVVVIKAPEKTVSELVAGSSQDKSAAESAPSPSGSPVRARQGEETKAEVMAASKAVVEDGKVSPPKAAESAEQDSTPISGQDALGITKVDYRVKSRSGSPANVTSPMAPIVGAGVVRPEAKQQSSLATTSLTGMHTGIPLTAAGLLGAPPLAPNFHSAAAATLYPHQMLSVPSAILPGQAGLIPTQSTVPKATSSDPTKLDKLAAELLLNTMSKTKKKRATPSPPPPLSQDEFYRHQKILKLFAKPGHRGSSGESSSSYSSGSYSRSSSSDSSLYSRSRSRSPVHPKSKGSHHSTRRKHRHERRHEHTKEKKEKKSAKSHEVKVHSREGRKERSRRHHAKRKRHDSPTAATEKKAKSKRTHRHRSRSRSPKLSLEEIAGVVPLSPTASTAVNTPSDVGSLVAEATLLPPVEVSEGVVEELEHHRGKHKKKAKKKHRHRHREEEEREERVRGEEEEDEGRGAAAELEGVAAKVEGKEMQEDPLVDQPPSSPAVEAGDGANVAAGSDESSSPQTDSPEVNGTDGKELLSPVGVEGEGSSLNSEPSSAKGEGQRGGETSQDGPDANDGAKSQEREGVDAEMGVVTSQEGVGTDREVGVVASQEEVKAGSGGAAGGGSVGQEEVEDSMEISVHAEDVLDSGLLEGVASESQGDVEGEGEGEEEAEPATPPSPPPPPPPPLTKEDLPEILGQLEALVDDDWRDLGLELHVPGRKLTQMQQKYPVEGLERVILHWLGHSDEKNCSWAYLVDALRAMGKKSLAHRINKKHLPAGKEEGEISDSEEGGEEAGPVGSQKSEDLPDLRETLNNSAQLLSSGEPDLRETLNSHKTAISRKRLAPPVLEKEGGASEGEEEQEGVYAPFKQSAAKRRKMADGKVKGSRGFSSSMGSATDSSSSSSESEEEEKFPPVVVKASKPKRRHSSSKKHASRDKSRSKARESRKEGGREKKSKKEKKHRSSGERKHSKSSHRPKRSSRVERGDKRPTKKAKKHKKTSRSERHH